MRALEFVTEARVPSVKDQIIADVAKHGAGEYFVRFTDMDKLGFSGRQWFGQTPDVDHPKFNVDYIGHGVGRRALWFYPLATYLDQNKTVYASEQPYAWLVKLKPDAWLQPVKRGDNKLQEPPAGKQRVGIMRYSNPPAAIFFTHGYDVIGRYYNYAQRHRRHGQVKGPGAGLPPTFFDRVRGYNLKEVNIDTDYNPDELTVKQKFIDYFVDKGYKILGEGRDQIAFLSPRNTVVKVLGLGDTAKQQAVEHYVEFFERNQRNPFYPKIYNSQRFDFEGDSYFLYETEYLQFVSNEDDTLDWLEHYLNHLGTDPAAAQEWVETNGVPDDIGEDQLRGLTQSTQDIVKNLAGPKGYMMDLSNIENIRRRGDGHLVIVDPVSI